jgi:hypothetical protein
MDLLPLSHSSHHSNIPNVSRQHQYDGASGFVLTSSPYMEKLNLKQIAKDFKSNKAKENLGLNELATKDQKVQSTRRVWQANACRKT